MFVNPDPANVATLRDQAYAIAKEQANVNGEFSDTLTRSWFDAAWDLCAQMTGFVWPPVEIRELVTIRDDGSFRLSYRPSSAVSLYSGYLLVATLPRSLERSRCMPALCCYCNLQARYWVGEDACTLPPRFVQAVSRVFAFLVNHRGDDGDEHILAKSGAMSFLSPDVAYVA